MRGLALGSIVVLYLHTPKQKVWGVLQGASAAGVVVRGLDVVVFDEWMRQEARGEEKQIGVMTVFYPMSRIERMEFDETVGCVVSYSDRFEDLVGCSAAGVLAKTLQRSSSGTDSFDGEDDR